MENFTTLRLKQLVTGKPNIGREAAKEQANHFILEHLPDRFCAGHPNLVLFPIRTVWSVPILLAYPKLGVIGEVGTIIIDSELGTVVGWTPLEEVEIAARELYEKRKAEIEAPFV
ncbi:MAG: hypothetical protein ONB05_10345 [candidate division KSB1 bacterium]|nr:hypothetical protein [candidate division KSB1 bacterium]